MDRRKLHKANGQINGKSKQAAMANRAMNRATRQDAQRQLEPEDEPVVVVAKPSRLERLKMWRLERDAKKKQEEELKPKPFVSVVKRGVFLDKTNYTDLNKQRRKKIAAKKANVIQNSTAAQARTQSVATVRRNMTSTEAVAEGNSRVVDMLTVPDNKSELNTTFETHTVENNGTSEIDDFESQFARTPAEAVDVLAVPENIQLNSTFEMENPVDNNRSSETNNFTSPAETVDMLAVPDIPTELNTTFEMQEKSGESANQSIKSTPKASLNTSLNYVSPFVTIGRGKGSARKEVKVRESFYKLELSQPQYDSLKVRRNREAASYFRFQVNQETENFNETINYWTAYKSDNDHVDSVYLDQIDVAIGQTKLLINKKFKQFLGLCQDCETGTSKPAVESGDLEGFWSMVCTQVENCNERFRNLVTLRDNEWVEVDLLPVKVEKQRKNRKAPIKGVNSSSGLQKMIEEARRKMKQSQITATPSTSSDYIAHNHSMKLRKTPARLSFAATLTPKSIIKTKTPGRRNMKSVAFSFIESPSTSKSPTVATTTPKPRVIKRRASTSGIPTQNESAKTEGISATSSSARRSHRRLFSVVEK